MANWAIVSGGGYAGGSYYIDEEKLNYIYYSVTPSIDLTNGCITGYESRAVEHYIKDDPSDEEGVLHGILDATGVDINVISSVDSNGGETRTITYEATYNGHSGWDAVVVLQKSDTEEPDPDPDTGGGSSDYSGVAYTASGLTIEDNYDNSFTIKTRKYYETGDGTKTDCELITDSRLPLSDPERYGYKQFKYGFKLNVSERYFSSTYGTIEYPTPCTDITEAGTDASGFELVKAVGYLPKTLSKDVSETKAYAIAFWEQFWSEEPRAVALATIKHYAAPEWPDAETNSLEVTSENNKFSIRKPWIITWSNTAKASNNSSPIKGYVLALHRADLELDSIIGEKIPLKVLNVNGLGIDSNLHITNDEDTNLCYAEFIGEDLDEVASFSAQFIPADSGVKSKEKIVLLVLPYTRYGENNESDLLYDDTCYIVSEPKEVQSAGLVRVKVPNAAGGTHWKEGQVFVKTPTGWKESEGIYVKTTEGWKESQ